MGCIMNRVETNVELSRVVPIFIKVHKEVLDGISDTRKHEVEKLEQATSPGSSFSRRQEAALIAEHTPLVRRIARGLCRQLPNSMEFEDLEQVGLMGLLEAIRGFNKSHGASLTTYASLRIQGAMIDEIRRNLWAPRSVFQKSREIEEARSTIQNRTGKAARTREIADALGLNMTEMQILQSEARFNEFCGMDCATEADRGTASADAARDVEWHEFVDDLLAAIERLPERERRVLRMYLKDDKKLHVIGDEIGVTESRVCQIYKQATTRLADFLSPWADAENHAIPA